MLVIEIDHVDPKPLEACLARLANVGRLSPDADHRTVRLARPSELRRQYDFVAPAADCSADQFLIAADGVHVGRIDECDAALDGAVDGRNRLIVVAAGIKFRHAHASKSKRGNLQTRASELSRIHVKTAP